MDLSNLEANGNSSSSEEVFHGFDPKVLLPEFTNNPIRLYESGLFVYPKDHGIDPRDYPAKILAEEIEEEGFSDQDIAIDSSCKKNTFNKRKFVDYLQRLKLCFPLYSRPDHDQRGVVLQERSHVRREPLRLRPRSDGGRRNHLRQHDGLEFDLEQ